MPPSAWRASSGRTPTSWSASRAAATRTSTRCWRGRRMRLRTPALAIYLMAGDEPPRGGGGRGRGGRDRDRGRHPVLGSAGRRADHPARGRGRPGRRDDAPALLEAIAATHARLGDEVPLIPDDLCRDRRALRHPALLRRRGGAGATGLIVADVPPDDNDELAAESARNGIDLVQLVALTSARARLALACRAAAASSTWSRRSAPPARATSWTWSGCAVCRSRARARGGAAAAVRLRRLAPRPRARPARRRRRRRDRRLGCDLGARERRSPRAGELVSSLAGAL